MTAPTKSAATLLNGLGVAALVVAGLGLAGTYMQVGDMEKAFLLGAFFCAVLVSVVVFGFAKVVAMLEALHVEVARSRGGNDGETPA